MTLQVSC